MKAKKAEISKKRLFSNWTTVGKFKIHAKVSSIKAGIPNIVMVPDKSHGVNYNAPQDLTRIIQAFFADLRQYERRALVNAEAV